MSRLVDRPTVLLLLGPPCAGKSSLVRQLVAVAGASVFRFHDEWRRQANTDADLRAHARRRTDPLGWLDEEHATRVIARAFRSRRAVAGSTRLIVCEGFPGTADQAATLLVALSAREPLRSWRILACELTVNADVARRRSAARVVCRNCEPTSDGDPRRPAERHPALALRCRQCGQPVSRRRTDEPKLVDLRRQRFDEHIDGIRAVLAGAGVPCQPIPAEATTTFVCQQVLSLLAADPADHRQPGGLP